jgi:hypothetical protein
MEQQRAQGVPVERVGRGVVHELGLARRISPYQAARYATFASMLTSDLPETFRLVQAGAVSEWRAMLVAQENGPTHIANGAGLCQACNHAKQAPHWHTRAPTGTGTEITIRTPTGHNYHSRPPDQPQPRPRPASPPGERAA